jgi:hypothetical protein
MFRGFSVLGRFAMHDVWRRHEGAFDRALRYALGYHPGDTAGQRRSTGARAEARGCAAGQGDALREGNHHTRRVLSVIHDAQADGQQVWEMARKAV